MNWADIAVGAVLIAALALAIRSIVRRRKRGGGCGGCAGCSARCGSGCASCTAGRSAAK